MFNTGINHFLQQLSCPFLDSIMQNISLLGSRYALIFIAFAFFAGYSNKKGIVLINMFGWTVIVTILLKNTIDFPRPLAVDPFLLSFGSEKGNDLTELQPAKFFSLFSDQLLTIIRSNDTGRYGFPSGHVSFLSSLMIGMALFIRKRWFWVISVSAVILTGVSRLYLAQHYAGDVAGGLVTGIVITLVIYYLDKKYNFKIFSGIWSPQFIFLLAPLLLLPFSGYLPEWQTGSLIGINTGYILAIYKWGNNKPEGKLSGRLLNVIVVFFIMALAAFISGLINFPGPKIISVILISIINSLSVIFFMFLSVRFSRQP